MPRKGSLASPASISVADERLTFLPDPLTSKRLIALAQLLKTAAELSLGPDDAGGVRLFHDLTRRALPLYQPEQLYGRFDEGSSVFTADEELRVSRPDMWPPLELEMASGGVVRSRADLLEAFARGTSLLEAIKSVLVENELVDIDSPRNRPSPPESLVGLVLRFVLESLRRGEPVQAHPLLNDLIYPSLVHPEPWKLRLPGWGREETKRDYEKRVRAAFRLRLQEHLSQEVRTRERLLAARRDAGKRRNSAKRYVPIADFRFFVQFQLLGFTPKEIAEEAGRTRNSSGLDPDDPSVVKRGYRAISNLAGIRLRTAKARE
jgi:hypothetical protein